MTTILDGPRGRRLCIELASARDERVLRLVAELGAALDPDPGRNHHRPWRTAHVSADGDARENLTDREIQSRIATLVRLLRRGDVAALSSHELMSALNTSVDAARSWQEPDGEDVLAAMPPVRKALQRWERAVLASPATSWWSSACRLEQWALDPPRGRGAPTNELVAATATAVAEWSESTRRAEALAQREATADVRSRVTGTWWSFPDAALCTTGVGPGETPVQLWAEEDSGRGDSATAVAVTGGGRFYEIATAEDWAALCRQYPLEVTASRRHDWFRVTGRDGRWVIPDWHRVAEHWDTVHLTTTAYLAAATREIVVDDTVSSMIAGWGPDEAYWIGGTARVHPERQVQWHRVDGQWNAVAGD